MRLSRRQGLDTQLMQQAETWAAAQGYLPLEVFPTLWSPQHPVLQLVKVLPAALIPTASPSAAAAQRR